MDQDKQRQRKQLYLRQHIIQQGYDPGEFVDYLSQMKLTPDIDLLSLNEVKNAVQSFKTKKQGSTRSSRVSVSIIQKSEGIIESQMDKKAKQIYYEKYGVYEDEFQRQYKCKKFDAYPKNKSLSPLISVSDPLRKSTAGFLFGVGATSFLSFKIDTHEYHWSVRRRYSDFQWLRNVLLKLFPSNIIPPLPRKSAKKRSTRDVEKRMHILSYFLNDISNLPTIMHSRYVLGFLSLTSDPQFQQLKRQGNGKVGFQSISQLQTQTGVTKISLTQKNKVYLTQIQKLTSSSQTIYKQMTASSKQLQSCFIQETNTLYKMSNLCADLFTNLKDFNSKVSEQYQQNTLCDIFVVLNNMLVQWGNIIRQQHDFIQKNFNTFIRYARNQIYSARQQLARIQNVQKQFFKANIQLQKKKQKIFNMGDFSKWDIPQQKYPVLMQQGILKNKQKAYRVMLPKDAFQVQKLRVQYAFYNTQYSEHCTIMMKRQSQKFCQNFKQFAITIKVNAQQLSEMWNEISNSFANPTKKNIVIPQTPQQKQQSYDDV